MANRGQLKYVPKDVLDEWSRIKNIWGVKDVEAFRKMADFSRIGREIELLMRGGRNGRY